MAYTTTTKVRNLTKLTESKITDSILNELIGQATAVVNSHIVVEVREEKVEYIDDIRKNKIHDGTTTKFYVKKGINNYLSDIDNDGEVTTSDIRVFKVDSENNRTELTVSSIDVEDGSFTLSSAPGTDTKAMYVWYGYSYYNVNTPDKLVELLASYLAASFAYLQKDHELPSSSDFGNIKISRSQGSRPYNLYENRFNELLKKVIVPCNKPRIGTYKNMI